MYLNVTVATPPVGNGISHKPIKVTKYVYYEHGRRYDSKRGYTVPQTIFIGKICEEDDSVMYPNANYLKFFPEAELPEELPLSVRSGCLKIGGYLVIKKVIEYYGLDEEISEIIGKDAGLFLDLAAYTIVAENNAAQYYPDYAYNHEFCMDNRMYSEYSYEYDPEDGGPLTDIAIDKIGLVKGQNFTLHYDYGDDWMFTIHVQKTEDEQRKTNPELIKSVGVLEQYPDYEDWDEDDEF